MFDVEIHATRELIRNMAGWCSARKPFVLYHEIQAKGLACGKQLVDGETRFTYGNRTVSCPACLVMMDAALEGVLSEELIPALSE